MKLHDLAPPKGATRSSRRVGRGTAGKGGKTAGRVGFEGGQQPILARAPKLRGFHNPFRVAYTPINLDQLDALGLDSVGPDELVAAGLARKGALVKVLARGAIARPVAVSAHGFSAAAARAIEAAGGSTAVVPLPFGNGRPPARGNQHTNR